MLIRADEQYRGVRGESRDEGYARCEIQALRRIIRQLGRWEIQHVRDPASSVTLFPSFLPDSYSSQSSGAPSLMIDPDLTHPNDRISGQVRHWLQPGLVFSDGGNGGEGWVARSTEKAVTEYLECAPGPPVSCRFLRRFGVVLLSAKLWIHAEWCVEICRRKVVCSLFDNSQRCLDVLVDNVPDCDAK